MTKNEHDKKSSPMKGQARSFRRNAFQLSSFRHVNFEWIPTDLNSLLVRTMCPIFVVIKCSDKRLNWSDNNRLQMKGCGKRSWQRTEGSPFFHISAQGCVGSRLFIALAGIFQQNAHLQSCCVAVNKIQLTNSVGDHFYSKNLQKVLQHREERNPCLARNKDYSPWEGTWCGLLN